MSRVCCQLDELIKKALENEHELEEVHEELEEILAKLQELLDSIPGPPN
mgnify:CR=1 FL=1